MIEDRKRIRLEIIALQEKADKTEDDHERLHELSEWEEYLDDIIREKD